MRDLDTFQLKLERGKGREEEEEEGEKEENEERGIDGGQKKRSAVVPWLWFLCQLRCLCVTVHPKHTGSFFSNVSMNKGHRLVFSKRHIGKEKQKGNSYGEM